jgi:hypothetical protein
MVVFRRGDGLPVLEEGGEQSLDQCDTGPAPGPGVLGLVGGPPPVRSCPPGPGVLGLLAGGAAGTWLPPVGDGFRE